MSTQGFSREHEVEADVFGVNMTHKLGYDPAGLYYVFEKFRKAGRITSPSGFNSHPPTDRRIERLLKEVKKYNPNFYVEKQETPKTQNIKTVETAKPLTVDERIKELENQYLGGKK